MLRNSVPAPGRASGFEGRLAAGAFLTVAILLATGCVRRVVTMHDPMPAPATAVRATMQRQIMNAVDAGEGDQELTRLRKQMANSPDDVQARLTLAAHYYARGFPDVGLEHYRLAAERFPGSAPAALALARALHAAHLDIESRDSLVSFCNRHPQAGAELFSYVGILEDGFGNFETAEPWHRAALERKPNLDSLHNNTGYNLLLQRRAGEAAVEFRRALELNPHSEIARNNLGLALAESPGKAISEWQSVTDPATAHSNMAAVLIEQKRYAEARREIQTALAMSPRNPAALQNLKLLAELDGEGPEVSKDTARHRVALVLRKVLGTNPASN